MPVSNRGFGSPFADVKRMGVGCRRTGASHAISNRTGNQGCADKTGQTITILAASFLIYSRQLEIKENGGNAYPTLPYQLIEKAFIAVDLDFGRHET